jgi:predicted DNA-binding transcriptional regulator AlpA
MNTLQITQISADQIDDRFNQLSTQMESIEKLIKLEKKVEEYLTRRQVADLFQIELSTLHNWCKKGKLKPYGIGNRVYFLRSEIDKALVPLNQI